MLFSFSKSIYVYQQQIPIGMADPNRLAGMESSAISVLKRAVELDQGRRFDEAVVCYQEGLQLLLDVMKGEYVGSVRYIPLQYIR